jgi:hypothetical protein
MVTISLLFALVLVPAARAEPAAKLRMDKFALKAHIKAVGPWCRGRPRVRLRLENTSQATLWLDLERSPKEPIEWIDYSYWDEEGGGTVRGGVTDGDFLGFLRSGKSAKLPPPPGESGNWVLELGPQRLRAGQATVGIRGPVLGATDRDGNQATFYEFEAEISVKLRRSGRCYTVGGGSSTNEAADPAAGASVHNPGTNLAAAPPLNAQSLAVRTTSSSELTLYGA